MTPFLFVYVNIGLDRISTPCCDDAMLKIVTIFFVTFLLVPAVPFAKTSSAPFNSSILEITGKMPSGGGYDTSATTFGRFKNAISIREKQIVIAAENTTPSFCSSSTYVVFLKLISKLQAEKKLELTDETQKALLVNGQQDGAGVWGRWNANGPGTARLFYQLQLGENFTDLTRAEPGDFMKAFWTEEIGAKERGHSVIFTGTKKDSEGSKICFWSSNSASKEQPAGMGEKCLAEKKFKHMLFSRLKAPENLNQIAKKMAAGSDSYTDEYLAAMLKRGSSREEMCKLVGCE